MRKKEVSGSIYFTDELGRSTPTDSYVGIQERRQLIEDARLKGYVSFTISMDADDSGDDFLGNDAKTTVEISTIEAEMPKEHALEDEIKYFDVDNDDVSPISGHIVRKTMPELHKLICEMCGVGFSVDVFDNRDDFGYELRDLIVFTFFLHKHKSNWIIKYTTIGTRDVLFSIRAKCFDILLGDRQNAKFMELYENLRLYLPDFSDMVDEAIEKETKKRKNKLNKQNDNNNE